MVEGNVFKTKKQQIRDIADGFFEGPAEGKKRYKMGKNAFLICKERYSLLRIYSLEEGLRCDWGQTRRPRDI
jgi:hypothetical protein